MSFLLIIENKILYKKTEGVLSTSVVCGF